MFRDLNVLGFCWIYHCYVMLTMHEGRQVSFFVYENRTALFIFAIIGMGGFINCI